MKDTTVNSEPTVEEALKELREMFPEYEEFRVEMLARIVIGRHEWFGETISHAMAQARQWNTVHARRFFCSCGGALNAEELVEHQKRGHN